MGVTYGFGLLDGRRLNAAPAGPTAARPPTRTQHGVGAGRRAARSAPVARLQSPAAPLPSAPSRGATVLHQVAERAKVQVKILALEAEGGLQLLHALLKAQKRDPEALDLGLGERAGLHAPQGLALH